MEQTRDRLVFRFLASPQETNTAGVSVAAGHILEWIDRAGYACAVGWSGAYCVTAYVGNVNFTRTIAPGSLVEVTARLIHTGHTSMQVLVQVDTADPLHREFSRAMDCILVFVAVDSAGKPQPVPAWQPESKEDRWLEANAIARVAVRGSIHAEMQMQQFTPAGTTPRTEFRFLALPPAANFAGKTHGGTIMRWINEAAFACAAGWSTSRARIVYSGGIHFYRPIPIGHLVEIEARLIHVSERRIHLQVRVHTADPRFPTVRHLATQCISVFIDPDEGGAPLALRDLPLTSAEDRRLDRYAARLVRMRLDLADVPRGLPTSQR